MGHDPHPVLVRSGDVETLNSTNRAKFVPENIELLTRRVNKSLLGSSRVESIGCDDVLPLQEGEPVPGHDDVVVLFHLTYGTVAGNNLW